MTELGLLSLGKRASERDERFRNLLVPQSETCTCEPALAKKDIHDIACPDHGLSAFLRSSLDKRVEA